MNRRTLQTDYERYVAKSYAGVNHRKTVQQMAVSARHYDTGVQVQLSYRQETTFPDHDEYTVAQTYPEPDFVEYEVVGAAETYTPQSRSQSASVLTVDLSEQAYVESFGHVPDAKRTHQHDPNGHCCDECAETSRANVPVAIATPVQNQPSAAPGNVPVARSTSYEAKPHVPAPPTTPQPRTPADVLNALSDLATAASQEPSDDADAQFLADMQSILGGTAPAENANTPSAGTSKATAAGTYPAQPAQPDAPTDNPHAIFDRIAQSMTYANAYNLGEFDLAQRFDNFDREASVPPPPPLAKAKAAPTPTEWVEPASTDFLRDLDLIRPADPIHVPAPSVSRAASDPIPLDPGVGGRSIVVAALDPGDILLSTTRDDRISRAIRKATGSEVSHASVYIGEEHGVPMVVHATDAGVVRWPLEMLTDNSTLVVAYRHQHMTATAQAKVLHFLRNALATPHGFDYWGMVQAAPSQLLATYCDSLPGPLRQACLEQARRLQPGTDSNDNFYCSELIFKALQEAKLSISTVQPSWSSPQEAVRLFFDGTLTYVGHLKTP